MTASWLIALALLSVPTVLPAEDEPPPAVGVWAAELGGLGVVEAVLPHSPLDAAAWPGEGGGLAVLTLSLVEGERGDDFDLDDVPRSLYRVRGETSDLEPIIDPLPKGVDAVHSSGGRLWLGSEKAIWWLDLERGELVPVLERSGLDLNVLARSGLVHGAELWLPEVGRVERLALGPEGPRSRGDFALPLTARRLRHRLLLRSLPVHRLGAGQVVAGPEAVGKSRIRHLLLPDGDGDVVEAWSRLPGPEEVEEHWYLDMGDQPVFVAATTEADRLGVFEKLKLRIFRLTPDRTRAGRQPMLAFETRTRNWYGVEPYLLDWNGDGKLDLALVQPEGMGPGDLVIDVYRGRANRFDPKALRTRLDAESARWHFGDDLDGDGVADLVVGTGNLSIHRGLKDHRRRVVEKEPWKRLSRSAFKQARQEIARRSEEGPTGEDRPSFRGRHRVLDLDGDGDLEIAIVRPMRGRSVVRLIDP